MKTIYYEKDLIVGDSWISLTNTEVGRKKGSKIKILEIFGSRVKYSWRGKWKSSAIKDFLVECIPANSSKEKFYPIY